jgi:hypothetical protein
MMLYADPLFGLLKAQCFPQVKHRPLQLGLGWNLSSHVLTSKRKEVFLFGVKATLFAAIAQRKVFV